MNFELNHVLAEGHANSRYFAESIFLLKIWVLCYIFDKIKYFKFVFAFVFVDKKLMKNEVKTVSHNFIKMRPLISFSHKKPCPYSRNSFRGSLNGFRNTLYTHKLHQNSLWNSCDSRFKIRCTCSDWWTLRYRSSFKSTKNYRSLFNILFMWIQMFCCNCKYRSKIDVEQ